MIQISKREFPNPVLAPGRDDYNPECIFRFNVDNDSIAVDKDNIIIPVSYVLECNSIEKLISDGQAKMIVKIKSSAASFCRIFPLAFEEKSSLIRVNKYSVVGNIEITGQIVAVEAITKFGSSDFNQLYFSGNSFDFRKGDMLATDVTRVIYIDDSELEKPIASIFQINHVKDQEEDISTDFSDEKISINLSTELNVMYWTLKDFNNGALRRYVTAVIVSPALIEAIDLMKMYYKGASEEDFSEKRWFRAIEKKCEKLNVNMAQYEDSSVALADKLLGSISLDSLKSFKDMLDQEMNNGETQVIGGID